MHSRKLTNGVMLNAYPDSIGGHLAQLITVLQFPEFKNAFSLFYVLPTFFNSDLDRGFSVIDYNINTNLVANEDLEALKALNIELKFDIVLNHLSVASPQFKAILQHGEASKYKDFFINWNSFWEGKGEKNADGIVQPRPEYLQKLFMRKAGLPVLKVPFPNGDLVPYWNTFYQKVSYQLLAPTDFEDTSILKADRLKICNIVNTAITQGDDVTKSIQQFSADLQHQINTVLQTKTAFLGQMDVNAKSPLVWEFYEETLQKMQSYGCKILRLDAFAYLHKAVGETNFFNTPGTWEYLERINTMAADKNITLLPEIHAEYGSYLHKAVAQKGYMIYDFFMPGLLLHAIEFVSNTALLKWVNEIITEKYNTVNMLGCHDGIPLLDLKGKQVDGQYNEGLLPDAVIEQLMNLIISRGGKVKNLYGPNGKKISYYQVNATYFSALGENPAKLLLARAIQLFMPGIPQIWYLDLFMGTNNYDAVEKAGDGGHKEINRTNLTRTQVNKALQHKTVQQQLQIITLRNTHQAFQGNIVIEPSRADQLFITWQHGNHSAQLKANLSAHTFRIHYTDAEGLQTLAS